MIYHLWYSPLTSKMANVYNYLENVDFSREINEKGLKLTKKLENSWKKEFNQLLGARILCPGTFTESSWFT